MKHLLLAALVGLLSACPGTGALFTTHMQLEGDMDVVTDFEHAVVLGQAHGQIVTYLLGSPVPFRVYELVAQGPEDLALVDNGEVHHWSMLSTNVLPAKSRALFTPALLAKYPDVKFEGEPEALP